MSTNCIKGAALRFSLIAGLLLLLLGGCAELNLNGQQEGGTAPASKSEAALTGQPYYPTEFKDILIPGELTWNREKSMLVRTASFAGGILNFSGRVDVNSLTDFFISSMQKDNWKLVGSVRYQNVLLAFSKPSKTILITIYENGFGLSTEVNIYLTEDINAAQSY